MLLCDTGDPMGHKQSLAYVHKAQQFKSYDRELARELLMALPELPLGEPMMDICDFCWSPFYWQPTPEIDNAVKPKKCCFGCWYENRDWEVPRQQDQIDPEWIREVEERLKGKQPELMPEIPETAFCMNHNRVYHPAKGPCVRCGEGFDDEPLQRSAA